jgi:hypothetical protein
VVGRELHTMCPHGEDHPGHDWGEVKGPGLRSRGPNMTIGSKSSKPTTMVIKALNWIRVTDPKDLFQMNYGLLV